MTIVETARLPLRPWREEDSEELTRLWSDPAVTGGRALTPQRVAMISTDSLRQWVENGFGPWAALDRSPVAGSAGSASTS